jgi:hypothetical protein
MPLVRDPARADNGVRKADFTYSRMKDDVAAVPQDCLRPRRRDHLGSWQVGT